MGVYIPNMEKPKDCSECILADKHLNGLCEAKYYCRLEADNCPLIEIPTPHGRLIDASELIKSYMRGTKTDIDDFYDTIDIIDNAPTILEEEK